MSTDNGIELKWSVQPSTNSADALPFMDWDAGDEGHPKVFLCTLGIMNPSVPYSEIESELKLLFMPEKLTSAVAIMRERYPFVMPTLRIEDATTSGEKVMILRWHPRLAELASTLLCKSKLTAYIFLVVYSC